MTIAYAAVVHPSGRHVVLRVGPAARNALPFALESQLGARLATDVIGRYVAEPGATHSGWDPVILVVCDVSCEGFDDLVGGATAVGVPVIATAPRHSESDLKLAFSAGCRDFVAVNEPARLAAAARREVDALFQRRELAAIRSEATFATFARRAAHDMNNYLAAISAFASSLKRDGGNSEDAGDILHAARQAATLCAYLTKADRSAPPTAQNVNVLLESVRSLIHTLVGDESEVAWELAPKPLTIRVNPLQLEQILINLALNARDASAKRLTIATRWREIDAAEAVDWRPPPRPGPYAEVVVTDDGAGMDPATRARIFEAFFTTKGDSGTGLGMATVRALVAELRGSITIDSVEKRGTTVRILLPSARRRQQSQRTPEPLRLDRRG